MYTEIKCPYCGEEMRFDSDSCHVWMKCDACLSCSPKIERPERRNSERTQTMGWVEYQMRCRETAEEAACRRPLRKPMTLEEANRCDHPVWLEFRDYLSANGWQMGMYSALHWISRVHVGLKTPEFGVNYRPWAFKPTDEERAAAPWEA